FRGNRIKILDPLSFIQNDKIDIHPVHRSQIPEHRLIIENQEKSLAFLIDFPAYFWKSFNNLYSFIRKFFNLFFPLFFYSSWTNDQTSFKSKKLLLHHSDCNLLQSLSQSHLICDNSTLFECRKFDSFLLIRGKVCLDQTKIQFFALTDSLQHFLFPSLLYQLLHFRSDFNFRIILCIPDKKEEILYFFLF